MANLRKEARGRECQIRIPECVTEILKRWCWLIIGCQDCAVPELSHRTFLAHGRAVHVMTKSTGVRASQTLSMQNSVILRALSGRRRSCWQRENIGMNQYHLKLPYPPSLNTYWRHARGRHYIAEKGTRYRQHITELIRQQNLDISTTSRIRISITANPWTNDRETSITCQRLFSIR